MEEIKKTKFTTIQFKIKDYFKNNKSLLIKSLIFTFVLGLLAHGYMYLNNAVSHDSFCEFAMDKRTFLWKIEMGRFVLPFYTMIIRGKIVLPWLTGLLAILFLAISVFFICKIFNITSTFGVFLTSSICTVNATVIVLSATFLNDLDCDMLGLLLSVLSVYLWKRFKKGKGYLFGIIPLFFSLGIYQSFISVAMTLVVFIVILELLYERTTLKSVVVSLCKFLLVLFISSLLYLVISKLCCMAFDTSIMSNRNPLEFLKLPLRQMLYVLKISYLHTIKRILYAVPVFTKTFVVIVTAIILLLTFAVMVCGIVKNKISKSKILFISILSLCLPLIMNVSMILSKGVIIHDIMTYSFWLTFLFVYLVINKKNYAFDKKSFNLGYNIASRVIIVVLCFSVFFNVRFANHCYTLKVFEKDANLSLFTRVVQDVEEVDGYKLGETKICILGYPSTIQRTSNLSVSQDYYVHGMFYPYAINPNSAMYYDYYFDYILMYAGKIASQEEFDKMALNSEYKSMPSYPSEGSIKMIDGKVVVKF